MDVVDRPIFIIGTGRSGTTLAYNMLVDCADLAFFTTLDERIRSQAISSLGKRLVGKPLPPGQKTNRRSIAASPTEPYRLLDEAFPGFSKPFRTLTARDVTPWARRNMHTLLDERIRRERQNRIAVKWTGWSRIGFMNEIFPEALFIHIHRDGRAAAGSLLRQRWWGGWGGPENWRWGPLSAADQESWESSGRSFAVLAALQWKMCFLEIEESARALPAGRFLRLALEDLQADPAGSAATMLSFTDLRPRVEIPLAATSWDVRTQDPEGWRDAFGEDASLVDSAIDDALALQLRLRHSG